MWNALAMPPFIHAKKVWSAMHTGVGGIDFSSVPTTFRSDFRTVLTWDIFSFSLFYPIYIIIWFVKDAGYDWIYQMGVIRSGKFKKVIYHSQAKKYKRTKNDIQKIAPTTKDLTTGTPLILGTDIRFCERGSSFCFTSDTRRDSDKWHEHHLILICVRDYCT